MNSCDIIDKQIKAPVAQLDRVADFESVGRGFEPLLAHQVNQGFRERRKPFLLGFVRILSESV
jgi:hypothetical protein